MKRGFKPIKFPGDESDHNHIIEWWYFNGNLKDKKGNKYAFMNCLFKANVKKIKIPFLSKIILKSKIPLKTIYFCHSLISDIKEKKFYPFIDYFSFISKDSFSKPLLFINYLNSIIPSAYINCKIEEKERFKYHLKTEDVDLMLFSAKKPLLLDKNGYIDLKSKKTYYYSLTNLKTKGTIRIKNKIIKVEGKSWMDHQWANTSYSKDDSWVWFSIQLDNNTEMVCFEYNDGKDKTYLASISYPNDKQEHIHEVKFTSFGRKWISPKTKAEYPLSWRIEIPLKGIDLEVSPLIRNQEMVFGTINYWEGPLKVKGIFNNKKVKGSGFLELAGYPSEWSNFEFAKDEIKNAMDKFLPHITKGTIDILSTIKTKMLKEIKV